MASKYIDNGAYATTGYRLSGAYQSITIGSKGIIGGDGMYGGPSERFTITNHGRVAGSKTGIFLADGGTVTNTGVISAAGTYHAGVHLGNGGLVVNAAGGTIAGDEAVGIFKAAGTVINAGEILAFDTDVAVGIVLYAGGTVTNAAGALIRGAGGVFDGTTLRPGGMLTGAGVVVNSGTIDATAGSGNYAFGVYLGHGGNVTNASAKALIEGHVGVELLKAGVLTNAGIIESTAGSSGIAVELEAAGSTFVDEAGSRLIGKVVAAAGTLELAGRPGRLAGLGSEYAGFKTVAVAAGGTWTMSGTNVLGGGTIATVAADGELVSSGIAQIVGTVDGGGTLAVSAGSATLASTAALDGAHMKLQGGTLTLGDSVEYAGSFAMSGGTFYLPSGAFSIGGAAVFTGGTITGGFAQAVLNTSGATTLTHLTLTEDTTWQVFGGTVTDIGTLTLGVGLARLTVEGDSRFDLTGNADVAITPNGTDVVDNAGILAKTAGTLSVVAGSLYSSGTLVAQAGTLELTGNVNDLLGTITGAGTLAFGGGSTSLDTTSVTVAHLGLSGAATRVTLGGSLRYAGGLNETGGILSLGTYGLTLTGADSLGGTITGAGTLDLAGHATLATGAVLPVSHLAISGGTVSLGVDLAYAGALTQSAGTLALATHTLTLTGAATFVAGAISGTGILGTRGAARLAGLTLENGATWQVFGATTDTGHLTLGNAGGGGGQLVIGPAGVLDMTTGSIAVAAGGKGTVTNDGALEKTAAGTSTVGSAIGNLGTITAEAGTLVLAGAVTGTGHVRIDAAATLRLQGAVGAGQTIAFAGTTGGALVLADPSGSTLAFAGSVGGFGGKDVLDLATFAFSGTPKLAWAQSGSKGTLTVTDGAKTARITLFGQYSAAGFHKAKDAIGGTAVTYTAPAQVALATPHR